MTPEVLVDTINARHGTTFRLGERFSGGEQGAFAVRDAEGRRFALKWRAPAQVEPFLPPRATAELLHAQGYPLPRTVCDGTIDDIAYNVREMLPGAPMGHLEARYIPRLLELNDLQAGLAPSPSPAWPVLIARSVLDGFDAFCVIATLRDHSAATANLLARLQTVVAAQRDRSLPTGDIVHFDFSAANILVDDGQISGVIDWDSPCAGDRAFDLATLLFYAGDQPDIRALLLPHVLARTSLGALQLYLAHMVVRQLDWSIRFHSPEVVDHWLRIAQVIVDDHFGVP